MSVVMLFFFFKTSKSYIYRNKLTLYIIIFLSFIFINSLIHFTSFDLLLKSLGNFRFLFLSLAVFFVFEKISDQQKKIFIFLNLLIIILVEFDILYQFIFYKNVFGFLPGMCTDVFPIKCTRFAGIFGDELIAGSYLSQIGFLILILFFKLNSNKNYIYLIIKAFLFIFLFLIILLTGERSPLLIFIICFFFIFFFKKKIINFFYIFIFLILLFVFLSKNIESINERYTKGFQGWGPRSQQETILKSVLENPWVLHYQAAIELFLENPILGHGPKSFRVKCANTQIDKRTIDQRDYYKDYRACSNHPHNYLLEFLSEHGIIGGLFFAGLIFVIIISIYKKCQNSKDDSVLILIGVGSLILSIIFPFKPSGSFFSTFNASMLFYIVGFFLHYLKKVK